MQNMVLRSKAVGHFEIFDSSLHVDIKLTASNHQLRNLYFYGTIS